MPRLSRAAANPAEGIAPYTGATANQVVAYNLARARAQREWTQDQARAALAPYLGVEWSKANYSAAERSMDGVRVRQFDADEIVAFARAFEVPIAWFFMPPDPAAADGAPIRLDTPDAGLGGTPMGELVDLVWGNPDTAALMDLILRRLIEGYGDTGLTEGQRRIQDMARASQAELVRSSFSRIDRSAVALRAAADQLEDLVSQAKVAAYGELGIAEDRHR